MQDVRTQYSIKPALFMLFSFVLLILAIVTLKYSINPANKPLPANGVFTICTFTLLIIYFIFRQLQVKSIFLTICNAGIIIKKFIPVGKPRRYLFSQLDGFKTGRINFHGANYEILYFIHQGKTIAQVSGYMHDNYNELKSEIEAKLAFLGEIYPPFLDL